MKVLVYLAERAGDAVTRQQLEEEVWRGMVVGYDALSNAITKLRRAFEDDPKHSQIIETIPKTGYRLVAEISVPSSGIQLAPDVERVERLTPETTPSKLGLPARRLVASVAALIVLVTVVAAIVWVNPWARKTEEAVFVGNEALPLPGRPSIAVLPFVNLTGDPEQEYFADGISDDLITDLSKVSGLFVIASNSVFTYKGKQVKVQQVAKDLGVRYVLEGSVRRAGDKVRINAQLIDATTGGHLWAERYDTSLADVFTLQDEVIGKIISALSVKLTDSEQGQLRRRRTDNLEAYDYYLRAERRLHGWSDRVGRTTDVLSLYKKSIELDPKFADAYAGMATVLVDIWRYGALTLPGPVARKRAYEAASKALSLDTRNSRAYSVLAILQVVDSRHDLAIDSARKAISLDPNNAEAYTYLARVLIYSGRHAEALTAMETAFRLNPKPPPSFYAYLGAALFWNGRYAKAIELLEQARAGGVLYFDHLAMTYAQLGRLDDARAVVEEMLERAPFASLAYYRVLYKHYKRKKDLEHRLALLRKAGIPEWPFGYEGRSEDRLDERAIDDLAFGRTWIGKSSDGVVFMQETGKDGKVAFRNSTTLLTGSIWVEGGMLCYQFPATGVTSQFCGYLFRNPNGTPDEYNEYVQVGISSILYFSMRP